MKKAKMTSLKIKQKSNKCSHLLHSFTVDEVNIFRKNILDWYKKNKRSLPWRTIAEVEEDPNTRGYSVWVSEIMLQQTQVSTVINYYNKWMCEFPSIKALSEASLEQVHKLWAGLGYYSRGTRLLEGSQKIQTDLDGQLPCTSEELMKKIPGVGRYTASAIASIAYREPVGVVDGNVLRVMARMRTIGAETTSQDATEHIWSLANDVVDTELPGDFNQALMELGATVCTPKNPLCSQCPVSVICRGFERASTAETPLLKKDKRKKEKIAYDIEDCQLCLPQDSPYVSENGVQNYPRKKKKAAPRKEKNAVFLVQRLRNKETELLMFQRPSQGLLANLWEFPSCPSEEKAEIFLENIRLPKAGVVVDCGEVFHQFSHISQTYLVKSIQEVDSSTAQMPSTHQSMKWFTFDEINTAAVSTAMKKVFQAWKKYCNSVPTTRGLKRKSSNLENDNKRQRGIDSFFKKRSA